MLKYIERLQADLLLRDLQPTTQQSYVSVARRFGQFLGRDLSDAAPDDIRRYLLTLRGAGRSPSTINVHHAALVFLFVYVVGRPEVMMTVPRAKYRGTVALPQIPNRQELVRLFAAADVFFRVLFQTIYATGLRSREVRHLRATDIRSAEGLIRVRHTTAKGRKERMVPLSGALLETLRGHWRQHQLPGPLLFPARRYLGWRDTERPFVDRPVGGDTANEALRRAQVGAGIDKHITLHTLRHAFATHSLEAKVEIHRLQRLMGHASIKSTQRYLHLSNDALREVPNPFDLLST